MALNNQLQMLIAQGGVPIMDKIQKQAQAQKQNRLADMYKGLQIEAARQNLTQGQALHPFQQRLLEAQTLGAESALNAPPPIKAYAPGSALYQGGQPVGQVPFKPENWQDPEWVKTQLMLKRAGKPVTNVNVSTGPTTPGFKKADETFATEYVAWKANGGFADTQKQLSQLKFAVDKMKKGTKTGFLEGIVPDFLKAGLNPELLAVKQSVEEVVQRNLRVILGAQFTEKEGERLISRAFDDKLPTKENIRRVNKLIKQISDAAKAKQEAANYFEKHRTIEGFKGKLYSAVDFAPESLGFEEPAQAQPKNIIVDY